MCKTCENIRHLPQDQALAAIERAVRVQPGSYEHFKDLLDAVLGTQVQDSDPALDEAWERGKRGP